MAATTKDIVKVGKYIHEPVAFPVKSGQTIYQGSIACVAADGYLYNYSSAVSGPSTIIGIVADGSANETPAATTADGSISGSNQKASAVAGDKTVRKVYLEGRFEMTAASIGQDDVGDSMYALDNQTVDETAGSSLNRVLGKLVTYISATKGIVELTPYA